MGLKPIGSEKLKGQDKINRIMQLATYGESKKNTENHISTTSFIKEARDGSFYAIVHEKDGYYLKRGLKEDTLDYINGIKNKKKNRFKSYSAALKKLNLALKPINETHGDGTGDSLYEQSSGENKFVLKTPEAEVEDEEIALDDEIGGEEDFEMDDELGLDDELEDDEMAMDDELEVDAEEEMEGAMKSIQKLTGKLGQKLRANEEEIESEDIKYVINSVLSAVDLDKLDDEDKEDIVDRFDEDETEYGDEELAGDDLDIEDEFEVEDEETLEPEGEGAEFDMDAMIPESTMNSLKDRVSTILESYYTKEDPKDYIKDRVRKNKLAQFIEKNSTSIEQELATKQYIKENKYSKLKGLTNSGLLVIESDNEQIRINKGGKIV